MPEEQAEKTSVFICGGQGCPKGGEHVWDGPGIEENSACAHCYGTGKVHDNALQPTDETCPRCKGDGIGGGFSAATCSKCGIDAITDSIWNGP
jgi:hypothetical protein